MHRKTFLTSEQEMSQCYHHKMFTYPPTRKGKLVSEHLRESVMLWASHDKLTHIYLISMFLKLRHRTAPTRFFEPLKKGMFSEGQSDIFRELRRGKEWEKPNQAGSLRGMILLSISPLQQAQC